MGENVNQFWEVIEAKMGKVPNYIKNILKFRGYESAVSIKTITAKDIESFQEYLKSAEMKSRIPTDATKENYYGVFWTEPDSAYILPGHVKFLEQIVEFVNITIVTKGYEYFRTKVHPQAKNHNKSVLSSVLSVQNATTVSSEVSSDVSSEVSSDVSRTACDKEKSLNIDQMQDQSMPSGDISIVKVNLDPSLALSVSDEVSDGQGALQETWNAQFEQERLFRQIVSWMQGKCKATYEQYAHALKLTIVEVTTLSRDSRLSISVRCFICNNPVPLSFVFGNGMRSDYYTPSNFYRHLVRHTKPETKPKSKRVTRSSRASAKGKTKRKVKGTSSQSSKKRRKNDSSSESDDSDSENVILAKELSNNYLHESDDLVDDDVDDKELSDDVALKAATSAATRDCGAVETVAQAGPSTQNKRQLHILQDDNKNTVELLLKENKILRHALRTAEKEKQDQQSSYNKDLNRQLISENHVMIESLLSASQRNIGRPSSGYRHNDITKPFAVYMKMIGGTLASETLHANLSLCWPSVSTTNKFIKDSKPAIIEGELRTQELFNYLKERNLPFRVTLSEDATCTNSWPAYDPATNQIVGFPLPLNDKGMPIPYSFMARNVKEIQEHFESHVPSSNAYVQMAQPLSLSVPPFCLLTFLTDNRFRAETVLCRWNFTTQELLKVGIKVDNFASDGDSRQTKVMKFKSEIGVQDLTLLNCEWFSCGSRFDQTYTQDIIHVGGKARNRILKTSRRTPIGEKIIAVAHLFYLMRTVSKDKHLLTASDINPKDRQNFQSVEKICSEKTIQCLLEYVPGSEGTAMFLKALNYCLYSYLDQSMSSADRVYKHWYGLFFFRIWRSWIVKSKEYTLKECFISTNCYLCIELNAHSLVKQLIKLIDDPEKTEFGEYMFFPDQQGSQPCETLFRQARSFSSMYSNVVNFTMLEFMNRMNKIQLQADIINDYSTQIHFPRFEKKTNVVSTPVQKLTRTQIIELIEKARLDLTKDVQCMLMETNHFDYHCQIKPTLFDKEFSYEEISDDEDIDEDEEFNDDDNTRDVEITVEDDDDCEDYLNDRNYLSGITGELELKDYSQTGMTIDTSSKQAIVVTNTGKAKKVMKSAIVWYLNNNKGKLSSDRLERVRVKDCDKAWNSSNIVRTPSIDTVLTNDHVTVGDWCVFEIDGRLLVGLILSFRFIHGKNFKEQSFMKSSAPIVSEKAVGVLATWYSWKDDGQLVTLSVEKHQYVNIDCYRRTISIPSYDNNNLKLSEGIVKSLECVQKV